LSDGRARLTFLGTAGSRFVVAHQIRSSGGLYLEAAGERVLIDPGPGSIVRCAAARPPLDPTAIDAVILTHGHIDHANDVNIILDAMTVGGFRKRGRLFAPRDCLEGEGAVVFRYLRRFLEEIVVLGPGGSFGLGGLEFGTTRRLDHGLETYGLKFRVGGRLLSLVADTRYFPGLAEEYSGSDTLVINVTRDTPFEDPGILHLSAEDAARLAAEVRPRRTVLTHFGGRMIKAGPERVARRLARATGLRVLAARDGLSLDLGEPAKIYLADRSS
jgi:ribonuclease BN (tRNA processing enzyme)